MSGSGSLIEQFSALSDPRQAAKVLYPLPEIVLLLLCATLAGADDFVEAQLWGEQNLAFLRRLLPYAHGGPSHDTLGDVVAMLDPALFKNCFTRWVAGLRARAPNLACPEVIAVDGKTSRRSHARAKGREPLHLLSAWASSQRLVLGQEAVADKSKRQPPRPVRGRAPVLQRSAARNSPSRPHQRGRRSWPHRGPPPRCLPHSGLAALRPALSRRAALSRLGHDRPRRERDRA